MTKTSLNINICPFGAKLQKYWDRRYDLFSRFDEGIRIDEEGLYSATPEEIALHQAEKMECKIVVDGFCGVGANAIAFVRKGAKVFAIEKDKIRLEMARHNAGIYGVADKIEFICGGFFEESTKIQADGVFVDPPWGGPDYKNIKSFKLSNFSPDGNKILKSAFQNFSKVTLRVPANFNVSEFAKFGKKYEVEDNIMYGRVIFRTVYFG